MDSSVSEPRNPGPSKRGLPLGLTVASAICWAFALFGALLTLAILNTNLNAGVKKPFAPTIRPLIATGIYAYCAYGLGKRKLIAGWVAAGTAGALALVEYRVHTRLSLIMVLGNIAVVGLVLSNWRSLGRRTQ